MEAGKADSAGFPKVYKLFNSLSVFASAWDRAHWSRRFDLAGLDDWSLRTCAYAVTALGAVDLADYMDESRLAIDSILITSVNALAAACTQVLKNMICNVTFILYKIIIKYISFIFFINVINYFFFNNIFFV